MQTLRRHTASSPATRYPDELAAAFGDFNRKAERLETEYRALKTKVAGLTRQLLTEQSARHRELLHKARLSDRLSRMFDVLPGAVLVIDGAGIIREHNDKALAMLHRPLVGCSWAEVARREFVSGKNVDGELEQRSGRRLSLARHKLASEPGEILLLTDVTESRRMAELLHRNGRLSSMGEMSARLAHQLRTPLASAMLYASQLEQDPASEPVKRAQCIVERLRAMAGIVDDMLRYSSGTREGDERFSAAVLVREAVSELASTRAGASALSAVQEKGKLPALSGNRAAIKGALLNLVENAMQAAGSGGRVEVSASRCGQDVCLAVRDDGPGVPPEVRSQVFEPFYTTRPDGTGLGLAVVRSVAEAHRGRVYFHSVPGTTTFALCLPGVPGGPAGEGGSDD